MIIVTDSTADLPESLIEEYQVHVVPLRVHFGEEVFLDWVELKPGSFYNKLRKSDILPRTSQPSPGDFVEKYREIGENQTIISIHISSQLSGTYQSAMMAKDMLPEMDIHVFDTRLGSISHGVVALEAAKAARGGSTKEEVLALVDHLIGGIKIFFMVDTLEYLQKNGRIGRAQAMLGSLLKVKPILTLVDGIVTPKEKARGRSKALDRLVQICQEEFGTGKPVKVAILHSDALEEALGLEERCSEVFKYKDVLYANLGAVIGTHVGPGAVGIAMYYDDFAR